MGQPRKPVILGETYNYLRALSFEGHDKNKKRLYKFLCLNCGNEKIMLGTVVVTGKQVSCGCIGRENSKNAKKKHGYCGTKVYNAWKHMKARCYNKNYEHYHRYGGRGITVSDEWLYSFETFLKDVGEPPTPKHQLDRIDNNGNYCKENCHWVLPSENCNNRSTYKNKTGFTGVNKNSQGGKYSARFFVNRKQIQVGSYNTPEEAYKARVEAIKKYNKDNGTNLNVVEYDDFISKI